MSILSILREGDPEAIASALRARFSQNLHFFSRYSASLAKRLHEPARDYNLWLDHKGINILNLHDKSLLFPEVEGRHGMLASAEYLANPFAHEAWRLYANGIKPNAMEEGRFPLTGAMSRELLERAREHGLREDKLNLPEDFLPATTLLGLGGGLHLEALRERYPHIHSLLIFEESLDLFRISCHLVDYPALFSQVSPEACYLFIENLSDKAFVKSFFEIRRVSSNFLRLELTLYETPKIAAMRELIAEAHEVNARGWGTFEDEMIGISNALENLNYLQERQKHPMLSAPRRVNAPICVVGNGASLDKLLPFIQENAERMIIFSAGTALKPLRARGIVPDFQIEIERIDFLHEVLEGAPLGEIPLMAGLMVNPKALSLARESYLFARGGSAVGELHEPRFILRHASPLVGNAALELALCFGSDVILAGLDCGYIEGESKHAQNSYYGEESRAIPSGCFEVKGNGKSRVYSDSLYALSRQMMEEAIRSAPRIVVLNLGEGAAIEGARAVKVGEFELGRVDKKAALEAIKASFERESERLLGREERDFHLQEWDRLLGEMRSLWNRKVENKRELFALVDELFAYLARYSKESPLVGFLVGGSISHLLQALLVDAIHIPNGNISTFFESARDIFLNGLRGFYLEYAKAVGRHRLKMER